MLLRMLGVHLMLCWPETLLNKLLLLLCKLLLLLLLMGTAHLVRLQLSTPLLRLLMLLLHGWHAGTRGRACLRPHSPSLLLWSSVRVHSLLGRKLLVRRLLMRGWLVHSRWRR